MYLLIHQENNIESTFNKNVLKKFKNYKADSDTIMLIKAKTLSIKFDGNKIIFEILPE